MNKRILLVILAWIVCVGSVLGVLVQRQQLSDLRAASATNSDASPEASATKEPNQGATAVSLSDAESRELLQLRSEVTRLTAKKRELSGVNQEAAMLREKVSSGQTNSGSGVRLPPGYIRKTDAQLVGFSTPENTMQSFLWAVQHHDITNLRHALSPEAATRFGLDRPGETDKEFFKNVDMLPGMAVQGRQALPDGSVELQVELIPGVPIEKLHLGNIAGEWKLLEAF